MAWFTGFQEFFFQVFGPLISLALIVLFVVAILLALTILVSVFIN